MTTKDMRSKRSERSTWRAAIAAALILALGGLAHPASAQPLNATQWFESLSIDADGQSGGSVGVDEAQPEPLAGNLNHANWSLDGDVVFGPAGPPHATTHVSGSHQSGLSFLGATGYVMISFEIRVNATGNPPVPVNSVPMRIHSQGRAEAHGDAEFFASALAFLDMGAETGPLVSLEARATNDPNDNDPNQDSFNEVRSFSAQPNSVIFGSMAATATVQAEVPPSGISANAEAFIDPIIEVSDDFIPGTSTRYSDVFEVEFSDGFFALGEPTAVEPASWSRVKSAYAQGHRPVR